MEWPVFLISFERSKILLMVASAIEFFCLLGGHFLKFVRMSMAALESEMMCRLSSEGHTVRASSIARSSMVVEIGATSALKLRFLEAFGPK